MASTCGRGSCGIRGGCGGRGHPQCTYCNRVVIPQKIATLSMTFLTRQPIYQNMMLLN